MNRQIVLDTETTGLEVALGHRIIEIGCVELKNRRDTANDFRHFLNPEREIDAGALGVHGITRETLADKPRFAEIAASLIEYLRGAELIIHNAEFDVGFLNAELARAGRPERIQDLCTVTDTVLMARKLHPGQKNNLDALCKRYGVDNSSRELHGALLDARLLAGVYLAMTGGQAALTLERQDGVSPAAQAQGWSASDEQGPLVVVRASEPELAAHWTRLRAIVKKAGKLLWQGELPAQENAS
jgi:DNA polymerase-3 subunit epsilon